MSNCKRFPFLLAPPVLAVLAVVALLSVGHPTEASKPDTSKQKLGTPKDQTAALFPIAGTATAGRLAADKLKIGYSDWPGWLVWEIAKQKDLFKDAGVDVDLVWFGDYAASIDAYTAGKLDGILIACNDSLPAKSSKIIVLTDFSEGNDMIIGKPGLDSIKDLKGKTIGLEENLVEHLLLVAALEKNELKEGDVKLKKVKTEETTQALKSGAVDAIGAWYPISGRTLTEVAGSKKLFTSADAPGLIYDALQVDPDSLSKRRDDWKKVVGVWFKALAYLNNKDSHADAVKIMAKRIEGSPEDLEKNLKGTHLLDETGNLKALRKRNTLDSIYGSLQNANDFYLKHKVYEKAVNVETMVDPSIVNELVPDK
jgi:NitT/TauT family transport system substrate-binding protein